MVDWADFVELDEKCQRCGEYIAEDTRSVCSVCKQNVGVCCIDSGVCKDCVVNREEEKMTLTRYGMKCDKCRERVGTSNIDGIVFCDECAIRCPRCEMIVSELVDECCHYCHWEDQWVFTRLYAETVGITGGAVVYFHGEIVVAEKDGEQFTTFDNDELLFGLVLDEWEVWK